MTHATQNKTTQLITYEYPLNEQIRICLRLEQLFNEFYSNYQGHDPHDSQMACAALLKIMNVIDRPDIKSKLTQTLTQYATTLGQLEQFTQIDSKRLHEILTQMDTYIDHMHRHYSRVTGALRQNDFLNQLRMQSTNPGGICHYSIPAYELWIHHNSEQRISDLTQWSADLSILHHIIELVLNLCRSSTTYQTATAIDGFYQQTLNPNLPCELLQIKLPIDLNLYPEYSVGRHRIAIRFRSFAHNNLVDIKPTLKSLYFSINCCRL